MNKTNLMSKGIAMGLAGLILINSSVSAVAAPASPLLQDVKALQASIDSGQVAPAAAIDRFSQSIVDKNISVADVNAFAKSQMTEKQYAAFQSKMSAALRGIDPATLSSAELGQIVGQALADLRTEGLYWDGCAKAWTGAAVIAAAIIVAVIAVGKNKSDAQIQQDYSDKIANEKSAMNTEIDSTQNWQTSFPKRIQDANSDIAYEQSRINSFEVDRQRYTYLLATADTQSQRDSYTSQIRSIDSSISSSQSWINSDLNTIRSLTSRMSTYAQNPAQVAIDVKSYADARDAEVTRLQAEEVSAIADAPNQRDMARKMGIGAGIGAAIGAGLLITNEQSGCFF